MTTREAEQFVFPWGKYHGRTVGQVARIDPTYLDQMAGHDLRAYPRLWEAIGTVLNARATRRNTEPLVVDD